MNQSSVVVASFGRAVVTNKPHFSNLDNLELFVLSSVSSLAPIMAFNYPVDFYGSSNLT